MASLERKVCKRLVLLIALCLLFSLIPVADSELEPKDAKVSVNENTIRLHSIPGSVLAPRICARAIVSGAMGGNTVKHVFEVRTSTIVDAHAQSSRKLFQPFSKPDRDELSEIDLQDMIALKQIHGAGLSAVNGAANRDREAGISLKRDFLADAIKPLDYQMERLKKGQALSSQQYIKVNGFQLIEEIEGESHLMNDKKVVSHGLIRVKPIERIKATEKELYPQDHQRRALEADSAEMAAPHGQAGMLWMKAEGNKAPEPGLSRLSAGTHFGLGLTREKEQIHNVVAALRQAGLFAAIAGTIEGMNLLMLPQFATIFVPTDSAYQALKQEDINFQLFQYHIVMQRYAFSQLCRLKEGAILYTLLPGYSIIVTGEQSPFKFSLDGVSLIAPDLYVDQSIAVHGIDGIFNCTTYGKKSGGWRVPEAAPPPAVSPPAQGPNPSSINGSVAGANNASVGGSGEAGQPGPIQQTAGAIPTPLSATHGFPFSFSPLGSELASDTDASDDTMSAKIGACAAATAFLCVLSVLCC